MFKNKIHYNLCAILIAFITLSSSVFAWQVNLVSPLDNSYLTNNNNQGNTSFVFNVTGTDSIQPFTLTLFTNITNGIWKSNQSILNADNDTNYELNLSAIPDGIYKWNINASNQSDFHNFSQSNFTFTIDNANPKVTLITSPIENENISSAVADVILNTTTLDLLSGINNVYFNITNGPSYVIYNAVLSNGNWLNQSFDSRVLEEGTHQLTVYAFDKAGNLNKTQKRNFNVDNIAPSLNASSLSGDRNFVFSPENQDGKFDSVNIRINASELIENFVSLTIYNSTDQSTVNKIKQFNPTSDKSNNFTQEWNGKDTGDSFVKDGNYTVKINMDDYAGNNNETIIDSFKIKVDNTAPQVSQINSPVNNSNITGEFKINITALDITTEVDEVYFNITNQGNPIILYAYNENYFWNATIESNILTDGEHNITIYANDSVANINKQKFITITVDNTAPKVTSFNSPVDNSNISGTVLLNVTAYDETKEIDELYFNISNSSYSLIKFADDSGIFWNATLDSTSLSDGDYNIKIYANDTLGNINNSESITITIDNTAPVVSSISAPINNSNHSGIFKINATVIDITTDVDEVYFNITNGTNFIIENAANSISDFWEVSINSIYLNDGEHNITIYANDTLGNINKQKFITITVDNKVPVIENIITPLNNSNITGTFTINTTITDNTTKVNSVYYNITDESSFTIVNAQNSLGDFWSGEINSVTLSEGKHNITIYANDSVGNLNKEKVLTITVDNKNPGIKILTPNSKDNVSGNMLINITGTDLATGIKTLKIQNKTNAEWTILPLDTGSKNNGSYKITLNTIDLPNGLTNITVNASDYTNNINSSEYITIMIDNQNPSVVIKSPASSSNLSRIIHLNATVTDLHSGVKQVYFNITNSTGHVIVNTEKIGDNYINNTFDSSLLLEDGAHTLTVYSIDYTGNKNNSESVEFTTDNFGPDFSNLERTPPGLIYNNDSVTLKAKVNDSQNTVSAVWILGNWTGAWQNMTAINTAGQNYSYTIPSSQLENQEVVGFMWYANDSVANTKNTSIQTFKVQNRVPRFNNSNNISDMSWVEDSGSGIVNLTKYFYDLDNDDLNYTYKVEAAPLGGLSVSINNDTGIAEINSAADWNGEGNVTFTAWDFVGAFAVSNKAGITVQNDENEVPLLTSPISPINFSEDTSIQFNLNCDPKDPGQICENYRFDASYPDYNNSLIVNVNDTTGKVILSTAKDWNGITYVKFLADDNGTPVQTDDVIVKVNITPVNDAPVINLSSNWNQTKTEDFGSWYFDLSTYKTDVDNNLSSLTWSIGNYDTSLINISLNQSSEILSFKTLDNKNGITALEINLTDSLNSKATESMTIEITSVNDIPEINSTIGPFIISDTGLSAFDMNAKANDDNDSETSLLSWNVLDWNPSVFIYAGKGTGQKIQFIPKEIIGVNNITDTVLITVKDPSNANDTRLVNVTVVPVNDAPSKVTDTSRTPANNSIHTSSGQVTLDWQDSIDPENQNLYYHVYFEDNQAPALIATVNSSEYTAYNLTDNTTYYWYIIASDGVNNASPSSLWQFTTDLDNIPNITSTSPLSPVSMNENDAREFNATLFDMDGDLISYNWSVDGITKSMGTTSSSNETVSYTYTTTSSDAGAHIIKIEIKDSNNNSGNSKEWNVNVGDVNVAPVLNVIPNREVKEDSEIKFNITASDFDDDSLTYSCNLTTVSKINDTIAQISWTPTNSHVGINTINCSVNDGDLSDSKIFTIKVNNTNDAPVISSYSPADLNPRMAEETGSQTFSITANDVDDGDVVIISWYLNNILNKTGSSFIASDLSSGIYQVKANATDIAGAHAVQSWTLNVTNTIVSSKYGGTIESHTTDEEDASGITIDQAVNGSIEFNETVNLSNAGNLDSYVEIRQGVVAIDSSTVGGLNRSALITMRNLNYTKTPIIYYDAGFNVVGFGTVCPESICSDINYNPSTGVLTFYVAHFSTYYTMTNTTNGAPVITSSAKTSATAQEAYSYDVNANDPDADTLLYSLTVKPTGMSISSSSGVISWTPQESQVGTHNVSVLVTDGNLTDSQTYELTVAKGKKLRISDLDVKVNDKTDRGLTDGDIISKEAGPESEVEFKIEVENAFTDDEDLEIKDIEVQVTIKDIDDGDDLEEESDEFDLDAGKDKRISLSFDVPLKVDEDTYDVEITVEGEDENGTIHKVEWSLVLEVEKEKHEIKISKASLSPSTLTCQTSATLTTEIINLGRDDEDEVTIEITNDELGLNFKEEDIDLEEGDDEESIYKKLLRIPIPKEAELGAYPIKITTYYNADHESDTRTVDLFISECSVKRTEVEEPKAKEETKEEPEVTIKTLPRTTQTTTQSQISTEDDIGYIMLLSLGVLILTALLAFAVGLAIVTLKKK